VKEVREVKTVLPVCHDQSPLMVMALADSGKSAR
jgi:hypothetical protein